MPDPELAGPSSGTSGLPAATVPHQADATYSSPPAYFTEALKDAERLLKDAAEIGIEVDDKTRDSVLDARLAVTAGWSEKTAANLSPRSPRW